jgi:hypothetical protein
MAKLKKGITTQKKVDVYETTEPLLEAMYKEMQDLSKKKPDGTLSPTKVKIINRLLTDIKAILVDETDSKYLDLLDDETLPQYSDVALILSQFSASIKKFHEKYYGYDETHGEWRWLVS